MALAMRATWSVSENGRVELGRLGETFPLKLALDGARKRHLASSWRSSVPSCYKVAQDNPT